MSKTPKLRFPEFSGEWEESKLKDFSVKITEKNKDFLIKNVISNSAKNGLISQRDFFDKDIANKENINGYYIIKTGDFVYNPRKSTESPYGPINRYNLKEKGVVSPLYLCFSVNEEINKDFLEQYFKSSKWHKFIYKNSDQGARHDRVSIKDSTVFNLDITLPLKKEQQKIASFLSLVDKKIEKQSEKVEAIKEYKKGMMQKIFFREIRFKDDEGKEFPEWEEKKAKELFINISDKNHNGDIEVLSATQDRGVIPRSKLNIDIKFEETSLISYKKVKKGDFIISLRSFQGGIENSKYVGLMSPAYTIFNFKDGMRLNHDFFSHIFKSRNFINRLNTLTYGIRDGKAISFKDFSEMKLRFPCLQEQQKIANFLSTIDKKLEKEEEKLEALKNWKKGLLQQMFV